MAASALFVGTGKVKSIRDLQYTPNGAAVLSFSFAVNSGTKDKPVFSWYKAVLWQKRAEGLAGKIQEGTSFFISGKQHTETYPKNDGTTGVVVVVDVDNFVFMGDAPTQSEQSAKTEEPVDF